jgi:predicted unusual protein kinase regulating ubiquinone biosynthesis (AarF/ABC1/UbiB family)
MANKRVLDAGTDQGVATEDHVAVPHGRLARMARLGGLALSAGAGVVLKRSNDEAAAQAAKVLGNLRGLAAKMGQMASYVDGLVPEDKREAFEGSLKVLRSRAPRSSAAVVRATVEEELGAPLDRLFVSWEDEPIASASIGQVHRARLPADVMGGIEVAVKVQHPGIRKAVESDLASVGLLEGFGAMFGGRRFDTKGNLELLRSRFREELDYELEAERLEAFTRVHAGDPTIVIPRLVPSHSRSSVLTTELVSGADLDDVLGESEDARRAWAETLWRFVFKGNLVGGMFNADPHPGNYLFQSDGRIAFLDYGCVQVIPEKRRPEARALHHAAIDRDEAEFARRVSRLLDTKPGELDRLAQRYTRLCFEPLFTAPYRITRTYAASLVDSMKTMALTARKLPDSEVFAMPPEVLFMNRLQFGFYSVLARLDVEVDFATVERGFLPSS